MKAVLMILLLLGPGETPRGGFVQFDTMRECRAALPGKRARLLAEWRYDFVLICAEVNAGQ